MTATLRRPDAGWSSVEWRAVEDDYAVPGGGRSGAPDTECGKRELGEVAAALSRPMVRVVLPEAGIVTVGVGAPACLAGLPGRDEPRTDGPHSFYKYSRLKWMA
ncbi:hypothetical protein [Amycolatopsis alkalitolerans]|uniref:Uncharacterized protein n=1 Tax=Amycolatopsis alkalitolerans TaxID=2547244 RepID=A0A5C4LWW9_9PSEU|nr:hypothetical protein [Amycolatopsis alkalitolerans]TNC23789.1 hypothetical protein FG385_20775 [Amycolatopsis alkalitolerans]